MPAKEKAEAEAVKKLHKEKIAAQERAEQEERETARIMAHKENLDANERAQLRKRAEGEIRNSGQYKAEFITNYLIESKENELIGEQLGIRASDS